MWCGLAGDGGCCSVRGQHVSGCRGGGWGGRVRLDEIGGMERDVPEAGGSVETAHA